MTDDYYQPATAAEFARLLFGTQPDQQQATDQQQQADDQQAGSDGSDVQAGPDAHGHEPQQDQQQQATDTDTVDVVRLLRWAQGIDHDDHHDGDGEQPRDPASLVGHALTQSIQQPKPAKQVADEHAAFLAGVLDQYDRHKQQTDPLTSQAPEVVTTGRPWRLPAFGHARVEEYDHRSENDWCT